HPAGLRPLPDPDRRPAVGPRAHGRRLPRAARRHLVHLPAPRLPPRRDAGVVVTATHCPYCALQCAMAVAPTATPGPPTITPLPFPTNRGRLCQKGWTAAEVLTTPDRLTTPLIRRDGELVPTDWDTALTHVAAELLRLRAEHGPASVAVFGGGGLTN